MRPAALAITAVLLAVAAGTPAAAERRAQPASTASVTLRGIAFHPATVTIGRGGSVRWLWRDGSTQHNVTFRRFHSTTKSGGDYRHRFTRSGTFRYRCTIHPGMNGKVIVR